MHEGTALTLHVGPPVCQVKSVLFRLLLDPRVTLMSNSPPPPNVNVHFGFILTNKKPPLILVKYKFKFNCVQ